MDIKTPPNWRKGQTIFNFLEWLRLSEGITTNQNDRMADPFYIDDEELDKLFAEFLEIPNINNL